MGRYLERRELIERDAKITYLSFAGTEEDPMPQLLDHIVLRFSVTSLGHGGNAPAQVCQNLIAEPLASQHPGFVLRLANLLEHLLVDLVGE